MYILNSACVSLVGSFYDLDIAAMLSFDSAVHIRKVEAFTARVYGTNLQWVSEVKPVLYYTIGYLYELINMK